MGSVRADPPRSRLGPATLLVAVSIIVLLSEIGSAGLFDSERGALTTGVLAPGEASAPAPSSRSDETRATVGAELPASCPSAGASATFCSAARRSTGPSATGPTPPWQNLSFSNRSAPPARDFYAMAYDPADHYVVLFGGYNASTGIDSNDTWTYSHGNWTSLNTTTAPPARRGAGLAYDSADGYLVLFGGIPTSNICCYQDTWKFSAGKWMDLSANATNSTNTPAMRYIVGLAYDVADGYLVLYGGCNALGCATSLNDTWKFAAGNWTLLNDNGTNPGDRGGEMMVWYPPANALFMYGGGNPGYGANNRHDNDTWEFSGGNWTQLTTPVNPGRRGDAWMVYDPVYRYIVMFAGLYDFSYGGNGPINDTWLYLSTGWTNESANLTVEPPARWSLEAAGVWDAADGYPLLFSGRNPSGVDLRDAWTYNWSLRASLITSRPAVDQNQTVDLLTNATGGSFSYNFTYGHLPAGCVSRNSSSIPCTFNATGTFPVNVTITDSLGERTVANLTIEVFSDPTANLTVAPTVIDYGQSVQFTVTVAGGSGGVNYSYRTLPAGCGTRSAPTLNCTPSAAGSFSISARIVDRAGFAAVTPTVEVTVHPRPGVLPVAAPASGIVPLRVNFSATGSGGTAPIAYSWEFGDGGLNASGANVSHVYVAIGHYVATVTATDARGDVATGRVPITVLAPLAVMSQAYPAMGVAPLFTNFSTLPTGGLPPYSFLWDFGDGSSTSTLSDPSHVYTAAGAYTATVNVTDAAQRTTSTRIAVLVLRPMSVAATANRTAGEVPFDVSFGATILGGQGPFTFLWSFGDGTTSTLANPAHNFRTVGQGRVSWSVSDALGEQAHASMLIEALAPLSVTLAPPTSMLSLGQVVNFSVSTQGGTAPVRFVWSGLPPGCVSANTSALGCQPTAVGNYSVQVVASDTLGGRSTASAQVEVGLSSGPSTTTPASATPFASPITWGVIAAVAVVAAVAFVLLARRRPPEPPGGDEPATGPEVPAENAGEVVGGG